MGSYTRVSIKGRRMYFLKFDPEIYQGLKSLKTKGEKVRLPLSIPMATLKIHREARKGPKPKLLKFLKRYYSLVLEQEPKLSKAINALENAKKPDPNQQQFKTRMGQIIKSLPSKSVKASEADDEKKNNRPKAKSKIRLKPKIKSQSWVKSKLKAKSRTKSKSRTKLKPKSGAKSN